MGILVTGGAGYIGSVCVTRLLKKKYNVVVIDNLQTGQAKALDPNALFYKGSILNKILLNRIFRENEIDAVIHFAAETTVAESASNPYRYFNTNLIGGITLLEAMRKAKCRKIIFSSTAAVYGNPLTTPISENHQTNPISAYGSSKLMFEQILFWYSRAYNLEYKIFRYFNAAGATKTLGENHNPETHLLPLVLQVALGKKREISIFGNDYDTSDGTCIRDYIHVADIADAHILSLENSGKSSCIYNLGNQKGYSVSEVIAVARKITGHPIPSKISKRRPGDPAVLIASSSLAKKELVWKPKFSSLGSIIRSQWIWQKKN